jgi:hypothetical protein
LGAMPCLPQPIFAHQKVCRRLRSSRPRPGKKPCSSTVSPAVGGIVLCC